MEPFFEHKHKYIHRELQDVGEVFFLEKGFIDIGFELNKKDRPVLRVKKGAIIGGYNCTFNTKTMYVYKCATRVEGYIIRKHAWQEILDSYDEISDIFKDIIKKDFFIKIKFKVASEKRNYMERLKKIGGFNHILSI